MTRITGLSLRVAAVAALLATAACGQSADQPADSNAPADAPVPAPAAAPAPSEAETAARLAALPAPYDQADLFNGKARFAPCRTCHTLAEGGPHMTGPNLHGMFGRQAGTAPGYAYSNAVKAAGFAWEPGHLDEWLTSPKTFMPGTKMTFVGLPDAKNRLDLIAYLMIETGYAPQ